MPILKSIQQSIPHIILWVCLGFATAAHAAVDINGVAARSSLGKEQYIAALYLEELSTDVKNVLLSDQRKRIEIKITTDRLLSRRFKRQWIEGIAINSGNSDLKKHAQNLADFSNMLKVKLVRDDALIIDRTFRRGVEVSVNGVKIGAIQDTSFFDLLLRAWVGPVPPSTGFKNSLLGGGSIDPSLLARFKGIRTTPERVAALQEAIAANPLLTATPQAEEKTPEAEPPKEPTKPAEVAVTEPEPTPEPEAPAEPTPDATPEPVIATTTLEPETEPEPVAETVPEAPAVAANTEQSDSIFEEEDEDEAFTAADLLSRQLYISKLTRWTSSHVKYPEKAIRRNQSGSVRVTVVISRDGKVQSSTLDEKSKFNLLNKEAIKAAKRASPYPAVPDIVKGDRFIFTVPIAFNLQ